MEVWLWIFPRECFPSSINLCHLFPSTPERKNFFMHIQFWCTIEPMETFGKNCIMPSSVGLSLVSFAIYVGRALSLRIRQLCREPRVAALPSPLFLSSQSQFWIHQDFRFWQYVVLGLSLGMSNTFLNFPNPGTGWQNTLFQKKSKLLFSLLTGIRRQTEKVSLVFNANWGSWVLRKRSSYF